MNATNKAPNDTPKPSHCDGLDPAGICLALVLAAVLASAIYWLLSPAIPGHSYDSAPDQSEAGR